MKHVLQLLGTSTEPLIFEGLADEVKIIEKDTALGAKVKPDYWSILLPPLVEGIFQVESNTEETSNDWQRFWPRRKFFIFFLQVYY